LKETWVLKFNSPRLKPPIQELQVVFTLFVVLSYKMEKHKKAFIQFFVEKGILLDNNLIQNLDGSTKAEDIYFLIKDHIKEGAILNQDLINEIISSNFENKDKTKPNIVIKYNYEEEQKKVSVSDFVFLFNQRYNTLKSILQNRPDLNGKLNSINRLLSKKERAEVAVIGIVYEKAETKNGNLMLTIEDPTGTIKILINKEKKELFEIAKDLVVDEVIGIIGILGERIIFANNILIPDIPTKDLKKAKEEVYAVFLSDLHVGSNTFLYEDFQKFINWINQKAGNDAQKAIASKVKYIFIVGDLIEGVGIYPGQENELSIKDIEGQYKECARLLKMIPKNISIIICGGNHDAIRMSEPQPPLYKDFAKELWEMENTTIVSNPSIINIHSSENFSGFDVLLYHGYSYDYYADEVEKIRKQRPNISDRVDLVMKYLLQKRHLAPAHSSTLYIPNAKYDPLCIDKVPDFFVSGHIHKSAVLNYKNTTLICGSCWQPKTAFQEKVGHEPEPAKVPIVNLKTREVKILKF